MSDGITQKVARFFEFGDSNVKPFHWKTPLPVFVFLFELAQELFERRSVEAEIKRKNVRIGETKRNEPPDSREGDVVFERGIADVRHPVMIVVHRVIDAVVAVKSEIDHWPAKMIQKYSVIGAAADARFDEGAVERRSACFRIAGRGGAPGFVERFSGRRANVFGGFHEHGRERSYSGRREAEALGTRGGGGSGDGFIDVEIRDELFLQVIGELLAPFRRAGERVFFAIPTADDDSAARADAELLEFAKRTRELHHGGGAAGRIHAAEDPGVAMIAEQNPFFGKLAAANARFDDGVSLHAGVHVHFHVNFYGAGEAIRDG